MVLTPRERLTVETFGRLKQRVDQLADQGRVRVVLNLGDVTYVDSIGVAELVRVHVMLDRLGGALALSHLHQTVAALLELTRLTDLLNIFPTESDALHGLAAS